MDQQLSDEFEKKTGIKISKRIRLHLDETDLNLSYGDISCANSVLTIIEEAPNNLKVCWKSGSGHIYKINDDDIDCNDIEFWFENFQPELYIQQYYPNQKLPFKIKNITYDLVVTRINLDCIIKMTLKKNVIKNEEEIVEQIDNFIAAFNNKSEKISREEGVIHNWNMEIASNIIIYALDLGSMGISFFKKMLTFLSALNLFERVEIE